MANKKYISERIIIRAAEKMKRKGVITTESASVSRALKNWSAKSNDEIRAAFKFALAQSA